MVFIHDLARVCNCYPILNTVLLNSFFGNLKPMMLEKTYHSLEYNSVNTMSSTSDDIEDT